MQYLGCLYLVAASLTAEYQSSNDATIVWEKVHTRTSTGLLEIGLSREGFTRLLIKGGYNKKSNFREDIEKWCPIRPVDDAILSQMLLQQWEEEVRSNRLSQLAIQPGETVDYETEYFFRLNWRHSGVFSILSDSNKMTVLTKMARDARKTIYQYSTIDEESRNTHYNPAAINFGYRDCLNYWRSHKGEVSDTCSLNKLFQGVDMGHITFTGKYSCMHDSTNGMITLEPETGIPLRLARGHTMFSAFSEDNIIIAWRGNVYLLRRNSFSDGFWYFIRYHATTKNSLQQSVSYDIVTHFYNSLYFVTRNLPQGSEISIAEDNHPAGDEMEMKWKRR